MTKPNQAQENNWRDNFKDKYEGKISSVMCKEVETFISDLLKKVIEQSMYEGYELRKRDDKNEYDLIELSDDEARTHDFLFNHYELKDE